MNSSIVDLSQKEGPVVLSDFCILFHLRIGSLVFLPNAEIGDFVASTLRALFKT